MNKIAISHTKLVFNVVVEGTWFEEMAMVTSLHHESFTVSFSSFDTMCQCDEQADKQTEQQEQTRRHAIALFCKD